MFNPEHALCACVMPLSLPSTKKSVPISLLIMSRAFTLQAPDPAKALAQSISAMDDDVVTEVNWEHWTRVLCKTPEAACPSTRTSCFVHGVP